MTRDDLVSEAFWRWRLSLSRLPLNITVDESIFDTLINHYEEEHRAYHNLTHILSMLREFEQNSNFASDISSVEIAIWYHDVIYSTTSSYSNEKASAEEAYSVLINDLELPESFAHRIENYIEATNHRTTPMSQDARILVDLDLSILGQSEKVFDTYEIQIRKEYEKIPQEIFQAKRIVILESFLNRPRIYHTLVFRNKYEEIARSNITRSLEKLQKPS